MRWLRSRLAVRMLLAVAVTAAGAFLLPRAFRSRPVRHWRAAFHLNRAEAHQKARETDQARAELRAALRLEPADAGARQRLVDLELAAGNWELAFVELESLTETHPERPEPFIALARLMIKADLLEAPESTLDKAIEAAPANAEAHVLRGDIRDRLGRYSGAYYDAKAALAASPDDSAARALLARTTLRLQGNAKDLEGALPPAPPRRFRPDAQVDRSILGAMIREQWPGRLGQMREDLEAQIQKQSWTEARRIVDAAAREYPGSAFASFLAGVLARTHDDPDGAEKHFLEALEAAPRLPVIIAALAQIWSRKQGPFFAGENLMKLAESDPGLSFARYVAARAYVQSRDPIKAEAALRRGLLLQPDSPVPYQHLGDYYFGLDRAADAREICQQGHERFPQDLELQRMLAQIETSLGRTAEAAAVYEDILARRPEADLARYRLALLLVSQEKDAAALRRATELARDLHADRPSDPLLLDTLGWVLARTGEVRRGRELLEEAAKAAPEQPGVRYHLGAVYLQENRKDLARSELKAALESTFPFPERLDALRLMRENIQAAPAAAGVTEPSKP